MLGGNLAYLERQLPQIRSILFPTMAEALSGADAVVVTQQRPEFVQALRAVPDNTRIVDLARAVDEPAPVEAG
jgi:hypothetical protein